MPESINIISKSAINPKGGPGKVFTNTIKGFAKIEHPYVLNQNPLDYKYNWVHDDITSLIKLTSLKKPCVVGPNLFVLPNDMPWLMPSLKNCIYLHPSEWCTLLWEGFNECKIDTWPVGIDWELFQVEKKKRKPTHVLLYFKKQDPTLLLQAKQQLQKIGFTVCVIEYGKYTESQYQVALKEAYFGVWIGTTESQGIGLQEALASGLPLIILENTNVRQIYSTALLDLPKYLERYTATSIPYWDDRCGIVIHDLSELTEATHNMVTNYSIYDPLSFVQENLSLEHCSRLLLEKFDYIENKIVAYKQNNNSVIGLKIILITKIHFLRSLFRRIIRKLFRMMKGF